MNVITLSSHSCCMSSAGPVSVTCIAHSSSDMYASNHSQKQNSEGEAALVREWSTAGVKGEWRNPGTSCFHLLFTLLLVERSQALVLPDTWGIPLLVLGQRFPTCDLPCISPQLPEPMTKCLWQALWLL